MNFYPLFDIIIQGERDAVKKKHGESRTRRSEETLTRCCMSDEVRMDT